MIDGRESFSWTMLRVLYLPFCNLQVRMYHVHTVIIG